MLCISGKISSYRITTVHLTIYRKLWTELYESNQKSDIAGSSEGNNIIGNNFDAPCAYFDK